MFLRDLSTPARNRLPGLRREQRDRLRAEVVRVPTAIAPARVSVALTVAGCPLRSEITNRVGGAVTALPGVEHFDIDFTVMTDEEREALRGKLGHAHAPDAASRPNPFTDSLFQLGDALREMLDQIRA